MWLSSPNTWRTWISQRRKGQLLNVKFLNQTSRWCGWRTVRSWRCPTGTVAHKKQLYLNHEKKSLDYLFMLLSLFPADIKWPQINLCTAWFCRQSACLMPENTSRWPDPTCPRAIWELRDGTSKSQSPLAGKSLWVHTLIYIHMQFEVFCHHFTLHHL